MKFFSKFSFYKNDKVGIYYFGKKNYRQNNSALYKSWLFLPDYYYPFNLLFGCHISVMNFILGGRRGYSFGKSRCALKKPPSLKINYKEHYLRNKLNKNQLFGTPWKFCNIDCQFTKLRVKKYLLKIYYEVYSRLEHTIVSRFYRSKFDLLASNELLVKANFKSVKLNVLSLKRKYQNKKLVLRVKILVKNEDDKHVKPVLSGLMWQIRISQGLAI